MNRLVVVLLRFDAAAEGLTGVALLLVPGPVCRILFGADLDAAGTTMARLAGIALLCLVLCCWLGRRDGGRSALAALLAYNVLTTVYLALLGIQGETVGVLLWPAAAVHAVMAALLAIASSRARQHGPL